MDNWAVVLTRPNSEHIALANLCQQGYECYLPRFKFHTPGKPIKIKPLFPRYLFALIRSAWYSINGTYGVSYVLQGEGGPAVVTQREIDKIRSSENSLGFVVLPGLDGFSGERFNLGQSVTTTEGPLQGQPLIYQGMSGRDRVKVLMQMLGQQTSATVAERSLVAV